MIKCTSKPFQPFDPRPGDYAPIETQFYFKLKVKRSGIDKAIGLGVFAQEDIPKGSTIAIGGGQLFRDFSRIPSGTDFACVFDEKTYIGPINFSEPTPNWYMNHSCDSNVKVIGRLILVARRDICCREELTVDYSTMAAGEPDYEMKCLCGLPQCRKIITGDDWKIPFLFERFYEEWPVHIQRTKHK